MRQSILNNQQFYTMHKSKINSLFLHVHGHMETNWYAKELKRQR